MSQELSGLFRKKLNQNIQQKTKFKDIQSRKFFIIAALILLVSAITQIPVLKSRYSDSYRNKLFFEFEQQLKSNLFDPEAYWEFRERYSPGTFIRDQNTVGFFSTFRIIHVENDLTPLLYYETERLKSLDGLITDLDKTLESIKREFPGEIVAQGENFLLIKINENEYIFSFVESIENMTRVVGIFDYLPEERELLNNKLWYNATYLKVEK